MYQQVVCKYGRFNAIQLSDPAPLSELLMMALKGEDLDSVGEENDDLKMKIAEVSKPCLSLFWVWFISRIVILFYAFIFFLETFYGIVS